MVRTNFSAWGGGEDATAGLAEKKDDFGCGCCGRAELEIQLGRDLKYAVSGTQRKLAAKGVVRSFRVSRSNDDSTISKSRDFQIEIKIGSNASQGREGQHPSDIFTSIPTRLDTVSHYGAMISTAIDICENLEILKAHFTLDPTSLILLMDFLKQPNLEIMRQKTRMRLCP
ncbi:hypothetical protein BJ508DRAFT_330923 [Ascobolus immersus RN42]|uniref:Uncharacterized protein n=1 Tax=Ascobolus immersus RN42 TaxID=1160509 RepID=A0A3N4HUE2_ASCIM|nr:hypothetical protein BJ508DRAFT_330923 [Ascobolus immersus RN42]